MILTQSCGAEIEFTERSNSLIHKTADNTISSNNQNQKQIFFPSVTPNSNPPTQTKTRPLTSFTTIFLSAKKPWIGSRLSVLLATSLRTFTLAPQQAWLKRAATPRYLQPREPETSRRRHPVQYVRQDDVVHHFFCFSHQPARSALRTTIVQRRTLPKLSRPMSRCASSTAPQNIRR